ncbi:MAG TPA: M64 family metallopeptidase [Blastocatellia bacterium]|nr:M64 family metallopeptidase [Blastocatellia bacterium]
MTMTQTFRVKARQMLALSLTAYILSSAIPLVVHSQNILVPTAGTEQLLVKFDGVSWEVVGRQVLPVPYASPGDGRLRIDLAAGMEKMVVAALSDEDLAVSAHELMPDGQLVSQRIPVSATLLPVRVPSDHSLSLLQVWSKDRVVGTIDLTATGSESWASSGLPPYTTETVLDNGPASNRFDIVFLGDGYQAADMGKYDRDVRAMSEYLLSTPPFSNYRQMFNIHKVNVISRQSGIDHPEQNLFRDTALDLTFNYGGISQAVYLPLESEYKVYQAAALVPQADAIVVLANDPQFGGSSGPLHNFTVVTTNPVSKDLLVHELGHSLGFLGDESDGRQAPPLREPTQVNVTLQATVEGLKKVGKWDYWIDSGSERVGLFPGGMGSRVGVYRPSRTCRMRTISAPFCPVCTEQIIKRLYTYFRPIESVTPQAKGSLSLTGSTSVVFTVTPIQPVGHSLRITWALDGAILDHTDSTLALSLDGLARGQHTITVTVSDPTPLVRRDPARALSASLSWTITK